MSEKATGFDWRCRSKVRVVHGAGAAKYIGWAGNVTCRLWGGKWWTGGIWWAKTWKTIGFKKTLIVAIDPLPLLSLCRIVSWNIVCPLAIYVTLGGIGSVPRPTVQNRTADAFAQWPNVQCIAWRARFRSSNAFPQHPWTPWTGSAVCPVYDNLRVQNQFRDVNCMGTLCHAPRSTWWVSKSPKEIYPIQIKLPV